MILYQTMGPIDLDDMHMEPMGLPDQESDDYKKQHDREVKIVKIGLILGLLVGILCLIF